MSGRPQPVGRAPGPSNGADAPGPGVRALVAHINRLLAERGPPIVVALDGPSGAGKSTLAGQIRSALAATVVPVDDFFAFEVADRQWDAMTPEERARVTLDWRRLRDGALVPLREGRTARWATYDFGRGTLPDGSYAAAREPATCAPAPVILLDGTYSARPELAELLDLTVLVEAPQCVRRRRLAAREDPHHLERWLARWGAAEEAYFRTIRPPGSFDVVLAGG